MTPPVLLGEGTLAPRFSYKDREGRSLSTESLRGRAYLVYFYPKDDTPGCTKEACGFRDQYVDFEKAGLTIIGVSPDDDESHHEFRSKYRLPFPLAADEDHAIASAYGAWGRKSFMGKSYDGIHRVSFLVGPDGKIAKVYPKVKPEDHASEVLADAQSL